MLTRRERLRKAYKVVWHQLIVRETHAVPVFIFGEMRSGTNMLTDCLDRTMRTAIFNETDSEAFDSYVLRDNQVIVNLVNRSKATHVVFKSLADSGRAIELLELFPSSKALWLFRNYEDVVNSALRKWTQHRTYLSYILEDPDKAGWRATNLPQSLLRTIREHYERGLDDASARALIWYFRNRLYFEQGLDSRPNVRLIRYEDLVQNPGTELRQVCRFLHLPMRDSYFKNVSQRSIRRNPPPKIDDDVAALCGKALQDLIAHLDSAAAAEERQEGTGT
jgi:Sulfotransferase domain